MIVKWKEERNLNLQMIAAEEHGERHKVAIVMRGGVRT
jgi:hypothetical protein